MTNASKYKDQGAKDAIFDYRHRINRLASELEALTKLTDRDDIADKGDRVAERVKTIVGA